MRAEPDPSSGASTGVRLTVLTLIVFGLLALLFARLWYVQVLAGERYAELAEQNRVRFVVTEAPRGRILDREGRELVDSRPALAISGDARRLLDSSGEPRSLEAERVIDRLAALLETTPDEVVERLTSRRYSPFRAIPIAEDVPPEIVLEVKERQEHYPGVVAETLPVRTYPVEDTAAHLVGYLGEVTEEQLQLEEFKDHRAGDLIGIAGLERSYERYLRGEPGWTRLEVNARDHVLGELGSEPPVAGADLVTTLDLDLQVAAERILRNGLEDSRSVVRANDGRRIRSTAGAVVAMDPRDGGIRAMASYPTYDPELFLGGIEPEDWATLHDPENETPLLNRAIQGEYPPGSVFKIVSGAAAMAGDLITPNQTLPCPPAWYLGNHRFRNWNRSHDGHLDAAGALMRSCDTYYYELAARQWRIEERQVRAGEEPREVMQEVSRAFGLGAPTGIDLPGERGGVIPGREWKEQVWQQLRGVYCAGPPEGSSSYLVRLYREQCEDGGRWRGGDAVNMSIGQGDVLTTPLQMAVAFSAVANGGTVITPRIGEQAVAPDGSVVAQFEPEVQGELPLEAAELDAIERGLRMVVSGAGGTGSRVFAGFPIPSAGKTGTAEKGDRIPYAWYVGYAPADDPEIVVAVAVEEGGGGSVTAAPIVRRVLEAAFEQEISPFRAGPSTD
jgi:penicillin-binding protein 2